MSKERDLFEQALKITTGDQRSQFLDEACGNDNGLRARLDEMLREHQPTQDFVPGEDQASGSESPWELQLGDQIGPYRLMEQIGEGGMGTVYVAEQQEPIRRKVALKVVKPGLDSREVVARFEAERQALAIMDHPNIARVLDAGTTKYGRPYFVMELVRGIPITDFCDQKKMTFHERLQLFVDVCNAVQHAHQKGVIHRDLKPSNVLVALHDVTPVVKVIDFGVAKAIDQKLTDKTVYTKFSQLIGTPTYMSPEQAELSGLDIDTRADIYSLGVLLYEILTGSTPFEKSRMKEASFDEMRRIIREEEPQKPSTKISSLGESTDSVCDLRQTNPRNLVELLSGDIDWIVLKALDKDRSLRYATASEFAQDVERYLKHEPVLASPRSAFNQVKKFVRRHRVPVMTAGAMFLLLVAGVLGTTWGLVSSINANRELDKALELANSKTELAEKNEALAKQEAERANLEVENSQAVNDFFIFDLLNSVRPSTQQGKGREVKMSDVLRESAKSIEEQSVGDGKFVGKPYVEATIRRAIGNTFVQLSDYQSAEPHLKRGLELNRQVLGEDDDRTIGAELDLALLYSRNGQDQEAEDLMKSVLKKTERVLDSNHRLSLRAVNDLGLLLARQHRYDEAEPLLSANLNGNRKIHGRRHKNSLVAALNYTKILRGSRQFQKTLELLKELEKDAIELLGPNNSLTINLYNDIGGVCRKLKQFDESEKYQRKAVDGYRALLGSEHSTTLIAIANMGMFYGITKQFEKAEPFFKEAYLGRRKVLGETHSDTLFSVAIYALNQAKMGQHDAGIKLVTENLELARSSLSKDDWNVAYCIFMKARVLGAAGQFVESEKLFEEAHREMSRALGERHSYATDVVYKAKLMLAEWAESGSSDDLEAVNKKWNSRNDGLSR